MTKMTSVNISPRALVKRFLLATAASFFGLGAIQAQTFVLNPTLGNGPFTWSTGTSWVGGIAPSGLGGETLVFGTAVNNTTANYNNFYTANNSTAGFIANQLVFDNQYGTVTSATNLLTVANTTGTLTLSGGGAAITNNGFGNSLFSGAFTMGSDVTINGTGTGNLLISGLITNTTNNLSINQTGAGFLNSGAVISITGANGPTFGTGTTTLTNGNLLLGSSNPLGSAAANTITINAPTGGNSNSIRFAATATYANNWTLNGNLNVVGFTAVTETLNGVLSGNGGININAAAGVGLVLGGANTFSGNVVLNPMANVSGNFLTIGNTTGTGSALNVGNFTLGYNNTLNLDNSGGVTARISPTANINMNRANLTLFGNTATASTQSMGTLTGLGLNIITINPNNSTTLSGGAGFNLTINTLTSLSNATYQFAGSTGAPGTATGFGSGAVAGTSNLTITNNPGGAIGGILPYAIYTAPSATTLSPTPTLVRWDNATNRIVPLVYTNASDFQNGALPLYFNSNSTSTNYVGSTTQTNLGNQTYNALVLTTSTTTVPAMGTSIAGTGTINITSGALVIGSTGSATASTPYGSLINTAGLNFGSVPGYIHQNAESAIITSAISGTAGIVKSGAGATFLTGNNTYTGNTYVNFGSLLVTNDSNLGNSANSVILAAPTANLTFQPNPVYTDGTATSLNTSRNFVLNGSGGQIGVTPSNGSMTISGTISGPGLLQKAGGGSLFLTGANTYTGRTVSLGGVLAVQNDAAMGSGNAPIEFAIGGTGLFQPLTSFSTNRNVLINGQVVMFTNGNNLTINGVIGSQLPTGTTANLFKVGPGDLVLTNANTFTGNVQIGVNIITQTAPTAQQWGGKVVLSGPNGALTMPVAVFSGNQGQLVLDNTAAVNTQRLSQVTTQVLDNGELVVIGNATSSVNSQTLGSMQFVNGGTVTLIQPNSGGAGLVTSVNARSIALGTGSIGFIRGDNFGGATGDRTEFRWNQSIVANAFINFLVGANSSTSAPTDFVQGGALVGNQVPLQLVQTYGTFNTASVASINSPTVQSLAAGSDAALRMTAGASLDLAGFGYTLTQAALLTTDPAGNAITNSGATQNFTMTTNARITNTGPLSFGTGVALNAATLNKFGTGTLTFNQPVSATTAFTTLNIAQGTVKQGVASVFPTTAAVAFAAGSTLDIGGFNTTFANVSGAGNIILGSGNLSLNMTLATTISGSISGSGNLIIPTTATAGNALSLSGNSAGWTGQLQILGGNTVNLNTTGAIGTGTLPILLGNTSGAVTSTLALGGALPSFSRDITVQAGSTTFQTLSLSSTSNMTVSSNIIINNTGATAGLRLTTGAANTISPTLSGIISGPGRLSTFFGGWNLWGANTYSGGTTLDATNTSIIGLGTDTVGAITSGPFGTGTVTLTTNGGWLRADLGARTVANPFAIANATANFGVVGTNDLTLTGNISLTAAAAAVHNFNIISTGTTTFSGTISAVTAGSSVAQSGPGLLVLSGQNTFTGGYTLNSGILGFGSSSTGAITSGPVGTGTLTVNAGVLRASGGARTVNNPSTINGDFIVDGSNALILGGNMNLGTANRTIVVTNSALTTFGGVVSGAGGAITKEGTGTLQVTGANTYTGGTTVNAGTLLVNNTTSSGTGSGNVTVAAGATLGGSGTISGSVTSSGTIAPGNSPGKLSINNNVTFSNNSNFNVEISGPGVFFGGTAGVDSDQLNLTNATSTWTIGSNVSLNSLRIGGYTANFGDAYVIVNNANTTPASGTGTFLGLPDGSIFSFNGQAFEIRYNVPSTFNIGFPSFDSGTLGITWAGDDGYGVGGSDNGGNIVIAAVPEPTTWAFIGVSIITAGAMIRRWRQGRSEKLDLTLSKARKLLA